MTPTQIVKYIRARRVKKYVKLELYFGALEGLDSIFSGGRLTVGSASYHFTDKHDMLGCVKKAIRENKGPA